MNCIIGIYLASYQAERVSNYHGEDVFKVISAWYNSIRNIPGLRAVVLMDIIPDGFIEKYATSNITFEKCYPNNELNAIDVRWKIYKSYLECHPEIKQVFFTDIGDVLVLKSPFDFIEPGKIYVGDEEHFDSKPVNLSWEWMMHRWNLIKHDTDIVQFVEKYGQQKVLNAGLVGGYVETVLPIISKMAVFLDKYQVQDATIDMLSLNVILYSDYMQHVVHGAPVNTIFWNDDCSNKTCWFKHK